MMMIIIIINCKWVYTQWPCAAMQDRTVQYSTITHITQNDIQHSRQPSICKITKKNQEHISY